MVTLQQKFGSFDLTPAANGVVVASWSDKVIVDAEFDSRARGAGSSLLRQRFSGRTIRLSGTVIGPDKDTMRSRLGSLLAALANGEQVLQLYNDRGIECVLESDVDYDASDGLVAWTWSASLRSRWPTWQKLTATTDSFTWNTATQLHLLPANGGNADAFPVVQITENGPGFTGKQLTLWNASVNLFLSFEGVAMNPGQTLTIDMREGRLFDGLSAPIDTLGPSGNWWPVNPGAQQTVELRTNVASPNFSVLFTWQDQYMQA